MTERDKALEVVRRADATLRQAEGKADETLRKAEGKADATLRQAEGKADAALRQAVVDAVATLRQAKVEAVATLHQAEVEAAEKELARSNHTVAEREEAQEVVRKADATLRHAKVAAVATLKQAEGKADATLRQAVEEAVSTLRMAEVEAAEKELAWSKVNVAEREEAQEVVRRADATLRQAEGKADATLRQAEGKADATLQQAVEEAVAKLRLAEVQAAKKELARTKDVFERFFALSLDMLCIAGPDGRFTRVSPAFDALGYSHEELLARRLLDLVHPEDLPATRVEFEKLAAGATTLRFQNRYRCKDGSYRWLSWTSAADASGTLYAVARDITDDKAVAETARQANQFLEAVLDNIPHMVSVKEAVGLTFVRLNRAGEAMLGVSRAEVLGKNDYACFPKDLADRFQAKDRATLKKLALDVPEEFIETPRGRRLLHTTKVAIADEGGTARYVLGISEDITERRAGEEARSRLAAVTEDSEDAIIGRTIDGLVTTWNRSAGRMFGYAADEVIGRPVAILLPASRKDEGARLADRILKGERVTNNEMVMRRKDGREIDVSVALSLIHDLSGHVLGASMIARDITALRVQRELGRAKEKAESAHRELESFSYSVAHDLRAPLRSIDGFSQALIEDYSDKLDAEGQKYLLFVRESAQQMARLIDNLLALSRVTRSDLHREKVDLTSLVRDAVARLKKTQPERQVDVVIHEGVTGDGDPRLLAVVLDNLMANAWKFTGKCDGARIEFGASSKDGGPAYFVKDNGAGFDMAFANKLFGAFQRLHTAAEFEGTGVGLATVQRIVNRHGGRIWAESEVGRGATFTFTLYEGDRVS